MHYLRTLYGLILLLPALLWAQTWQAESYQKWQQVEDTSRHGCRIGGELCNWQNGRGWEPIRNGWMSFGVGPGTTWRSQNDVMNLEVNQSGRTTITVQWGDSTYQIVHQFNGLILENKVTTVQYAIPGISTPAFGLPSVSGDTLSWEIYDGVHYQIIDKNASVTHRIVMAASFTAPVVNFGSVTPGFQNLSLSTDVDFTLTNIPSPEPGQYYQTILKNVDQYRIMLDHQWLGWTDQPDTAQVPVLQSWTSPVKGEMVMREWMDLPQVQSVIAATPGAALIWHNDEITIGNSDIEDAELYSGFTDYNYGGSLNLNLGNFSNSLIRVKNVASNLGAGATISACICSCYCSSNTIDGSIGAYRVFKPWVEGDLKGTNPGEGEGCTWNDWSADTYEWGTAGCLNADDGGSDNSGDGTGADRKATAEDATTITTANTWYTWDITVALAQGWYDETIGERGLVFDSEPNKVNILKSSENALNKPRFWFEYSTGGAPAAASVGQVIRILEE